MSEFAPPLRREDLDGGWETNHLRDVPDMCGTYVLHGDGEARINCAGEPEPEEPDWHKAARTWRRAWSRLETDR